ncbi:hypothetical protein RKD55_003922 [Rossellomorea marisflavi]
MSPRRHEKAHRSTRGKRPPAAKRNEPITPHPTQKRGVKWLFTKMQGELLDHSLSPHHQRIVQCSGGWSTPAERRADETPQARGGSSLAPRKAAPAAKRNEPITPHPTQKRGVKWLFTKMQGELLDHSLSPHHQRIVQCSGGWSTPAERRADETPQARGGSSLAPRKAATRSETERTHHTPTQLKNPRPNEPIAIGKLNQHFPKTLYIP